MAQRPSDEDVARRGPERHTRTAEPAVEAPVTSPASAWPTAASEATPSSSPERPASIRVKKKRKLSRRSRLRLLAKRIGYGALVVALLAGLAVVVALIIAPHNLF